MRVFGYLVAAAGIAIGVLVANGTVSQKTIHSLLYYSPCDSPTTYRVGVVDERFQIPQAEFREDIQNASSIWSKEYGKDIFAFDPKAELRINLIYDVRQSLNTQIDDLQGNLKSEQTTLKPRIEEYENLASEFKKRVADLNAQIEYWNSQGGAPKEEYDKLTGEQEELRKEAERLNEMARQLNLSTQQYNQGVVKLGETIETFNEALSLRPEEGVYDSDEKSITIYITNSKEELVHTLAHELGHAIRIGHNANPQAIMYPYTSTTVSLTPEDIQALNYICAERSTMELVANTVRFYTQELQKRNLKRD